jgi:hypothetical protein
MVLTSILLYGKVKVDKARRLRRQKTTSHKRTFPRSRKQKKTSKRARNGAVTGDITNNFSKLVV